MSRKSTNLNIRMEPEIRQELDRLAKVENRTASTMARWAMKLGLLQLNKIVRSRAKEEK